MRPLSYQNEKSANLITLLQYYSEKYLCKWGLGTHL